MGHPEEHSADTVAVYTHTRFFSQAPTQQWHGFLSILHSVLHVFSLSEEGMK